MIKILISISILLLLAAISLTIISSFYEIKRPNYSNRVKKLSLIIFLIAILFVGIGVKSKINVIKIALTI